MYYKGRYKTCGNIRQREQIQLQILRERIQNETPILHLYFHFLPEVNLVKWIFTYNIHMITLQWSRNRGGRGQLPPESYTESLELLRALALFIFKKKSPPPPPPNCTPNEFAQSNTIANLVPYLYETYSEHAIPLFSLFTVKKLE